MNLKKAELRFKREWANAATKLGRALPEVETVAPAVDADIVVNFTGFPEADALDYTGCKCTTIMHNIAALIVPPDWMAAPTRRVLVTSAEDRLHNALLDAGVADWIDITSAEDGVNLTANLLDILTGDQLAKLNAHYDVVLREQFHPAYSFAERTSGGEPQTEAAPLVDPAKVEARLRAAWGGARAGKILKVEATDNPRRWLVTTVKSIPANANFLDHGLEQIDLWAAERRALVEITPVLWSKLLGTHTPVSTTVVFTATISDGDTEPITTPADPVPLPELDDRDVELNALRVQVEELQGIIRTLTPVTDEWQTLKIALPKDGKLITHPEIAAEQAKGWDVHHVQYALNGEDRLFVLMVKRGKAKHEVTRHYAAGGYVTAGNPFMHRDTVVPVNGKGEWSVKDAMIDQMNAEIAPTMNALAAAFGVNPEAWR